MKRKSNALIGCFMALLMCAALTGMAQNRGDQGGRDRSSRGDRRNFDPAQMQERMLARFQEEMKASDDEWQVIKPLLEDVLTKQRDASMFGFGRGRGFGGRGGPGGRGPGNEGPDDRGNAPDSRTERGGPPQDDNNPEMTALQELLDAEDSDPADIQAKLEALRTSRKDKQEALKQARENLQKVLTVRQEAMLVLRGILE